MTRVE
jgi:hypothetical protein